MNNKLRGRVKALKKNYGFIAGVDGKDYFFHWSMLNSNTKTMNQLTVGTTVEFVPELVDEKERAKEVIAID